MKTKIISILLALSSLFFIFGCGGGGGSSSPSQNPSQSINVSGHVQKGPFINGTSIFIQELNTDLEPTGVSYQTLTVDDLGTFSVGSKFQSSYVEIIATGYYFDEISGSLSSAPLTLRAIADISKNGNVNVNILTSLTRERMKYLINNNKMTFADAQAQAEAEILKVFNISEANVTNFEKMDIGKEGDSNAILLAISAILQGNNTVAELSDLITKIALDIKENGRLDDPAYIAQLKTNAANLVFSKIRGNLENRYFKSGSNVTIPKFEDYVDTNGDGVINKNDFNTYIWDRVATDNPWGLRTGHAVVAFNNKLWILGGMRYYDDNTPYLTNDVWNSANGVEWTQVATAAPWQARYGHAGIVFDNKIWIVGGSITVSGTAINDVWYSSDGVNWTCVTDSAPGRYYQSSVVFDNQMWIIGGIGSEDSIFSKNESDVWRSADGINWIQVMASAPWGPRYAHTSAVFDNKIWVMAGDANPSSRSNEVWYSADGINWINATASSPWGGRRWLSSAVFDNKLWILGGEDYWDASPYYGDVWYSTDGVSWTQSSIPAPWSSADRNGCAVLNNRMFLIGGYFNNTRDGSWIYKGKSVDVWAYFKYGN